MKRDTRKAEKELAKGPTSEFGAVSLDLGEERRAGDTLRETHRRDGVGGQLVPDGNGLRSITHIRRPQSVSKQHRDTFTRDAVVIVR
jgi:hypothetical protein